MEDENNNISHTQRTNINFKSPYIKKRNYFSRSMNKVQNLYNTVNESIISSSHNSNLINKQKDLSYFRQFQGFFNKNFNLTNFKKQKEDSRSRSKSPERNTIPHQIRGNGIPKNFIERLNFLKKFYQNGSFLKSYEKCPKRNDSTFEEFCEYIIKYAKKNSVLNGILLTYYFICHEIKYDYEFKEREEDFKTSQKAENVYENGYAISLGFTNIFEFILKKLDVKVRHIEGYCKFLPKDNKDYSNLNNFNTSKKLNKNNISTFTMYNNNTSMSIFANSSRINLNNYDNEEVEQIKEYINHCWNAFYYKGEWYLADTLMGSGSYEIEDIIKGANQFKSRDPSENFNIFYILSDPKCLLYSHYPAVNNWQLTEKILNFKQFLNKSNVDYPTFYKGISKYSIELLTHKDPFILTNNKESLLIKLKSENNIIEGNLFNAKNGQKISEVRFSFEREEKIFTLEPIFPKCGEYLLRINIREISSNDLSYHHLFDYRIKVIHNLLFNYFEKYNSKLNSNRFEEKEDFLPKIGRNVNFNANNTVFHRIVTDYKKIFPSKEFKKVCYDTEGFILLEPRTIYLRKGIQTKFKVRIKGASLVSLLDGNKWINLKRVEAGVYEGQKIIETDNVSICCLRGKNVFTEVFKFRPGRNKYEISHSQTANHSIFKKF